MRFRILLLLIVLARVHVAVAATNPAVVAGARAAPAATGSELFERHCAVCHGMDGKGGRGPSLNRAQLLHAPDDTALKLVIAQGILPEMPSGKFLSEEDLVRLTAYVRSLGKLPPEALTGDPARGARIFTKAGCNSCHIIGGKGSGYGPELTTVGNRRSASYLRRTIAKPADTIPEGFLAVTAVTASGEKIEGICANEDTFTIQIEDNTGRYHSFRKQDLRDLRKLRGETPMPSYDGIFSASELEDVVAYLASLRGKQ